ncbi:MAG: CPBP family intramembrane metalloprotease [Clostridia bacterium]|nr:CPBP family intramembrane metalloprotease [Clostridia bacterium]
MTDFDTFGEKSENNAAENAQNKENIIRAEKPSGEENVNTAKTEAPVYTRQQAPYYRPQYMPPQNEGYRPGGTRPYGAEQRPQYRPPQNEGYRPGGTRPYGAEQRPQYRPPQNEGYRPGGTRPYGAEQRPQYAPPVNGGYRPQYVPSQNGGYRPQYMPPVNSGYGTQNMPYGNTAGKPGFTQKVIDFFVGPDVRPLGLTAGVLGIALIMTLVLQFTMPTFLAAPYLSNTLFSVSFTILMSTLCMALPFLCAHFVLKRIGACSEPLPFGRPRKGSSVFLLIVAGLGLCYFGNLVSGFITTVLESLGISSFTASQDIVSGMFEPTGVFESIVLVIGMSCMPALFEELVFRGIIMQSLRKYGDWFAIFASALVFALIHGNIAQTPFAFIAGIALGYISVVSGSLWPSVILHFLNNFLATINSFLMPALSDEAFYAYSSLSLYGIVFVGFAAFIALFVKNRSLLRLRKGEKGNVGFIRKHAVTYLSPTFFIGLAIYTAVVIVDLILPFIFDAMGLEAVM